MSLSAQANVLTYIYFSSSCDLMILLQCFREIKRLRRQKRKLKERLVTKGDVYREAGELTRQEDLFRLANIKSQNQLEEVERGEMETAGRGMEEESGSEEEGSGEEEMEGRLMS